jgi:putative toxin-antitoxin system antitoxin component (TIGR02293 family)
MTLIPLFPDYPSVPVTASGHLAWHLRLTQGLPVSLFRALSEKGLFNRPDLAEVVFGKRSSPRQGELPLESANSAYRVLVSLEMARGVFGGDVPKAVAWLSSPQLMLRGRIPLGLMSTSIGFDYVRTAVERLGAR